METATTKTDIRKKSVMQKLVKSEPDVFSALKPGDLVEAEFITSGRRGAYFSIKNLSTGIVYGRELMNARSIIKKLSPGDTVNAKIVEGEGYMGYVELSLTEADKHKVWNELKDLKDKQEIITVTIEGANSGGLMGTVEGVKAFLPVSQLSSQHYPRVSDSQNEKEKILDELKKLVEKEIPVRILTVNQKSNKLIISEKEVTDESLKEVLTKYSEGDVIDGVISGVADFGAFMRFDTDEELEGLIHISEIDHKLVDDPREVISVGDKVRAKITEIKDGRVSLSLKALKDDPWKDLDKNLEVGQEISGEPFKYNPFGAFINVDGIQVQGLIHVSEFGSVDAMKKELELAKKYTFIVDTIKPEEKRLILTLKK